MSPTNFLDKAKVSVHTQDVRHGTTLSAMGSPVVTGSRCASQHSLSQASGDPTALPIRETPTMDRGSSGTSRTLSAVVGKSHPSPYQVSPDTETFEHHPRADRKIPYVFISKRCAACGQFKKLWHYYRVKDWSASDKRYWYPSARCKPCHNTLRAANRRERKAREVVR